MNLAPFVCRRVDGLWRRVGWSLWPSRCLICAEPGLPERDLCSACLAAWPRAGPACLHCAMPVPVPTNASAQHPAATDAQPPAATTELLAAFDMPLCGACLRRRSPLHAVHAACAYRAPIDRLLLRFKFHRDLAAGRLLSAMMGDAFAPLLENPAWRAGMTGPTTATGTSLSPDLLAPTQHGPTACNPAGASQSRHNQHGPDPPAPATNAGRPSPAGLPVLIPIPLHRRRLRERGYDQALELARPLARRLDLPLQTQALLRPRDTPAQSRLDASQRRRNLRGAFAWRGDIAVPAHVVLIDDVMTTGATLHSAARTLQRAGVLRVDAWVCARVLIG